MTSHKSNFYFAAFLILAVLCAGHAQAQPSYQTATMSAYPNDPPMVTTEGTQQGIVPPNTSTQPLVVTDGATSGPYQNYPRLTSYSGTTVRQPSVTSTGTGLQQLPSYRYDPNLDTSKAPPTGKPETDLPMASTTSYHPYMGLETRSGIDLDARIAYYEYEEPNVGSPAVTVKDKGPWYGFNVAGTAVIGDGYFFTADGHYAFGYLDYSGSGTADNEYTDSIELRGLFGKDFIFKEYSLSPYTGFGYRTLYNDARGTTSIGAQGYRRYNQLYYLPFGVHPRTHVDTNTRLAATIEFDHVLHGVQKSDLADAGFGDPNIKNVQSSGFGLRGDIMYERQNWSIGPYFTYWNMEASKTKTALDNSSTSCAPASPPCVISAVEPHNTTIEAGIRFSVHLF